MSTLIGLKCEQGLEGIVLISDFSGTQTKWNYSEEGVAYKQQLRTNSQKFYIDNNRSIVLGASGTIDDAYIMLLSKILKNNELIKKAIKKKFFKELFNLNISRWGGYYPDADKVSSLLVATRFDEPRLYSFILWEILKRLLQKL